MKRASQGRIRALATLPADRPGRAKPVLSSAIPMEHRLRLRVRYGETDCMGRVYHPNYLSYMECGRVEAMREWGFNYAETE